MEGVEKHTNVNYSWHFDIGTLVMGDYERGDHLLYFSCTIHYRDPQAILCCNFKLRDSYP